MAEWILWDGSCVGLHCVCFKERKSVDTNEFHTATPSCSKCKWSLLCWGVKMKELKSKLHCELSKQHDNEALARKQHIYFGNKIVHMTSWWLVHVSKVPLSISFNVFKMILILLKYSNVHRLAPGLNAVHRQTLIGLQLFFYNVWYEARRSTHRFLSPDRLS